MKRFILLSALFGAVAANAQTVIVETDKNGSEVVVSDLKDNQNTNKSFSESTDAAPRVYSVVEEMPTFPGGEAMLMRYIATHIKYPTLAMEYDIMGMVALTFAIMEDGSVGEVKVEKSMRKSIAALSKDEFMKENPSATDQKYEQYLADFNNMRKAEAACDAEAVRIVKSLPRFIPGRQQGKPVNVWYTLPIRFQLQ